VIYVLDASATVDLLIRSDVGERVRRTLTTADPDLASVVHLDAEVFSALARLHRAGVLEADEVAGLLDRIGGLQMHRLPITPGLLRAAWALRARIAARDGLYVAATAALGARLLTTDGRLARAVGDLAVPLS
jgi:predicted nucleic acid-binding protein